MASFKQHCVFGFWKASLMKDPLNIFSASKFIGAIGQFDRMQSLKDLPSDAVMIKYISEAVQLNKEAIKLPNRPTPAAK